MKLVTWNVNGIRSVGRQGFEEWFKKERADIVCVQEIKAMPEQLDESQLHPDGAHSYWYPAEKPGYSGVALFSRKEPLSVSNGIGVADIDREGRVQVVDFGKFVVLNCYFPNSQRDHARLPYKLAFCKKFHSYTEKLRAAGKQVLICGDFNIAHKEIDLKNPKSNVNNAGFLPQERAWMDQFLSSGYVDTFREFEKGPDHYTWWSYRPGVRAKNVGWRLDYWVTNQENRDRVKITRHDPLVLGSDHCPVVLELRK
jgi:exodeoxyribonuclease-3